MTNEAATDEARADLAGRLEVLVSFDGAAQPLTYTERHWLQMFRDNIDEFGRVVTWHMSKRIGVKTRICNHYLQRLADKGLLRKEVFAGKCTIFKPAS